MFCPQCGQRQTSNEARFCSACGLPLNVVTELLANGGQLPWRPTAAGAGQLSPRQRGIRQGALMMLSTVLVVPLLAIIGYSLLHLPGQIIAVAAVGCPLGGLLRILYALFLEDSPLRLSEMRTALEAGDLPSLQRAAHTLKGSAGSLCGRRTAEAALRVEQFAEEGDLAQARQATAALGEELGKLEQALAKLAATRSA